MAFKNLEDRFNQNVDKLYGGATSKFEGGKTSAGKDDDPLIVKSPGKGYWTFAESRTIPISSTKEDVKRLTLFSLSSRGIRFLAKQQLLQTGNTFEFTRALNPAFVVANAVPFLHVKRNLRPLKELVGKTDTSYANVRTLGQLQFGTYNQLKSRSLAPFILQEVFAPGVPRNNGILKTLGKSLLGPLKSLKDTVTGTLSAFNPLQKRNVGEIKDNWGKESWALSRPELVTYVRDIQKGVLTLYQKNAINSTNTVKGIGSQGAGAGATTDNYGNNIELVDRQENVIRFIKYFDPMQSLSTGVPGTDAPNSYKAKRGTGYLSAKAGKKISYIKDPSNKNVDNELTVLEPYKFINTSFEDPITVSFAMGKDDHIPFRAFIKDLQQNITPEYKSYQYVGRIERFVNYSGVQRDLSFKLGIIAFSSDELDTVWRRINYLTGMAFPYGFNKGIMQPNIMRLTIGNLYVDQPGYISSISTNFNELTETWDIDAKVPISAVVDIKFVIIEKASRIASSPFYGITDGSGRPSDRNNPMKGFSNEIPIPAKKDAPADARKDPPKNEIQEEFDVEAALDPVELGIEGRPLPPLNQLPEQPLPDVDPEYIYP